MESAIEVSTNVGLVESIGYGTIVHLTLWLLICLHLLIRPRDARTSLLWIFFTSAFPFVGPFAYVLFGINTVPSKSWKKQYSDILFQQRQGRSRRHRHPLAMVYERRNAMRARLEDGYFQPLNRVLESSSANHPLLGGNEITLIEPASEALEVMFQAISQAQHHVHLASYIFGDGVIGRRLMGLLVERARAGVQVRVLYDAFGSAGPSLRLFFWHYRKVPNLHLVAFSQANLFKRKFQFGLRNHRKLLIIDGNLAFTGGINFYDVYLTTADRAGILDYHFRVKGPMVLELQYTFQRDWYYMTDQPAEELLERCYYPVPSAVGTMMARLQNSGPTRDEAAAALDAFLAAINLARRQILIITPYFVPPEPLLLALRQAAFRGVDVKILVPSSNNYPTLKLASRAVYERLLLANIRLYERKPPFIHAKAMLIDDGAAIIGSANFDNRSLFLNYETNIVVFDQTFAANLKAVMLSDFAEAREIVYASWRQRHWSHKLLENFFNLFHPIA